MNYILALGCVLQQCQQPRQAPPVSPGRRNSRQAASRPGCHWRRAVSPQMSPQMWPQQPGLTPPLRLAGTRSPRRTQQLMGTDIQGGSRAPELLPAPRTPGVRVCPQGKVLRNSPKARDGFYLPAYFLDSLFLQHFPASALRGKQSSLLISISIGIWGRNYRRNTSKDPPRKLTV